MGGALPFNEQYKQNLSTYIGVNEIISEFMDNPAARLDPMLKFTQNQFALQHIQTLSQFNPNAVKAFYATRSDSFQILQALLKDYLEENE
jgi:hypothetical protein